MSQWPFSTQLWSLPPQLKALPNPTSPRENPASSASPTGLHKPAAPNSHPVLQSALLDSLQSPHAPLPSVRPVLCCDLLLRAPQSCTRCHTDITTLCSWVTTQHTHVRAPHPRLDLRSSAWASAALVAIPARSRGTSGVNRVRNKGVVLWKRGDGPHTHVS